MFQDVRSDPGNLAVSRSDTAAQEIKGLIDVPALRWPSQAPLPPKIAKSFTDKIEDSSQNQ